MILVHPRVDKNSISDGAESVILEILDCLNEIMSLNFPQFREFVRPREI